MLKARKYSRCKDFLESSANVFRLKESFLESPLRLIRIAVPAQWMKVAIN